MSITQGGGSQSHATDPPADTSGGGVDLGQDNPTGTTDSTKPEYNLGGNNADYFQQTQFDPTDWVDSVSKIILSEMIASGAAAGYDATFVAQMWSQLATGLMQGIDQELLNGNPTTALGRMFNGMVYAMGESSFTQQPRSYWLGTKQGFQYVLDYARQYAQAHLPNDLANSWTTVTSPRGGSGSGSGLTEAQIRQQFDLDQLAAQAQAQYRQAVISDLKDPKQWAREYVDAVVAGKGLQKIDFTTFIDKKIEGTARYAAIYRDKPPGVSIQQYLQSYYGQALSVLGPTDQAGQVAISAAQMGSSAQEFQSRLNRTDAVTGSAPFINQLQERLQGLGKVFKT